MALSAKDCVELRGILDGKAVGYTYKQLARFLRRAGFEPTKQKQAQKKKGSHRIWKRTGGGRVMLKEPGHGPVLPPYTKETVKGILETGACDEHV